MYGLLYSLCVFINTFVVDLIIEPVTVRGTSYHNIGWFED